MVPSCISSINIPALFCGVGVGIALPLLDRGVRGKMASVHFIAQSDLEIGLLIRNVTYPQKYDSRVLPVSSKPSFRTSLCSSNQAFKWLKKAFGPTSTL